MALGGTQVVSTVAESVTVAPPSSPSPTDSGNNGGGSMQRGANYFFGFLITFVVLLLIFIGCGIGSRRRFARRRALFLGTLDPQWGTPKEMLPPRPSFFETPLVISEDKTRWGNLNPLSVRVVRKPTEESPSRDQSTRSGFDMPSEGQTSSSMFPPWLRRPRRVNETPASNECQVEPELPESIQVAVVISMPTSSHEVNVYHDERVPEYQIGVASLPWHHEMPS